MLSKEPGRRAGMMPPPHTHSGQDIGDTGVSFIPLKKHPHSKSQARGQGRDEIRALIKPDTFIVLKCLPASYRLTA